VARALLVGCGCHGRELGRALLADGWAVRGTTRRPDGVAAIEAAGIEATVADPGRVGEVLELVGDVAVVAWLFGSATGSGEELEALNRLRLESLLPKLVDTPVRGFVYEGAGTVDAALLEAGAGLVEEAARTWRIPARIVRAERDGDGRWTAEMAAAIAATVTDRSGSAGR
jgi:nucleoside-diphosphate-sugar epimerase